MKRLIADFTHMRAGTRIDSTQQIEKCPACGRKGAASRRIGVGPLGTTQLTVIHVLSVTNVVAGFGLGVIDKCTTTVESRVAETAQVH
jgi:hypothetical protein